MTPPTTEELLRLARKALPSRPEFGEDERDVPGSLVEDDCDPLELSSEMGSPIIVFRRSHPRNREALHAALLVLSGELDVAELLEKAHQLCQHAADMATSYATSAADSFDGPEGHIGYYLKGQRDLLGIYADSFRKLLPKEDP